MYGYIYLTTNLVNGKMYVGKHKSSYFNPEYKGSGKRLWYAINKYGWDNFKTELLTECDSLDELNQCEIDEIKRRDAVLSEQYYNLNGGGEGWQASWQSPDFVSMMLERMSGESNPAKRLEVRERMKGPRPQMKGENNPNYQGKSVTQKQRDKLSQYCKDHYQGEGNPMYGKRGELSPHYGKVHVNNGVNFITVPFEELDHYLSQGYVKTKNKGTQGKVYMNNGVNSILINSNELDKFISLGWSRGKKRLPIIHTY